MIQREIDYNAVRRRVERRLALRISVALHSVLFVLMSPGLHYNFGPRGVEWMWFIVLLAHIGYWLFSELRERAVQREIEREEARWLKRYEVVGMQSQRDALRYADLEAQDEAALWDDQEEYQWLYDKRKRN